MSLELQENICTGCGSQLDPSAQFCPQCGLPRGRSRVATAPPADPLIGREVIGQYVIQRKLAAGGMGAVYLADQRSVGRQAVVKVMHPELSRDPSVAARFDLEARAASLLNHPHIVTIYNYGAMEDGTLFLAMEYCRGQSLDSLLGQGGLSWERAARVGVQICDALAEAHRNGIVHRDLKPSNIMLVEAGRQHEFVKVLDFGIAKLEGSRVTRTGSILGTPQYMSPEQFRGETVDGRSDLYSLGIVLYEMVAGLPPFESQNTAGWMHKHLEEAPQPPSAKVPGLRVPRGLEAIILCALAKDASDRFADADEMARSLEAVLSQPEQIPHTRVVQRAAAGKRSALWLGIAGGAVLAAGISFGAVILLRPGARSSTEAVSAAAPGSAAKPVWLEPVPAPGGQPTEGVRLNAGPDAAPAPQAPAPVRGGEARSAEGAKRAAARRSGKSAAPGTKLAAQADPPVETGSAPAPQPAPAPKAPQPAVALAEGSIKAGGELVSELRRWMSTARVPPSEWDSTLGAYKQAEVSWPAAERDARRREYLTQLIALYKKPSMQLSAGERLPLAKLRQVFLSMTTKAPLTSDERSRVLEATLATYDQGNRPAKDRTYFKRMAVVQLIKTYAADPDAAMR